MDKSQIAHLLLEGIEKTSAFEFKMPKFKPSSSPFKIKTGLDTGALQKSREAWQNINAMKATSELSGNPVKSSGQSVRQQLGYGTPDFEEAFNSMPGAPFPGKNTIPYSRFQPPDTALPYSNHETLLEIMRLHAPQQ